MRKLNSDSQKEIGHVNLSVIIAAKNEASNIKRLVHHLTRLDFPSENFEVIIVNDNSTDETLATIKKETETLKNFLVLDAKTSITHSKREALELGITNARNPYILITDADCHPQKAWLSFYSNRFCLGNDMLFGIAPFYQHDKLVNKISCFENLRSTILSISMALVGFPYTASARNFGFKKNTFESLGGYSKTKDTISGDDDLLLREAIKHKMKIGIVTDDGSFVYSESKLSFREFFHQRARHTQTSFHYLIKNQIILGVWHVTNIVFLFSPLLMFLNPLFGILFPVKLFIDYLLVQSFQKKFGYNFSAFDIFYLQVLYEIFLIIHFLNARFTEVKWK